MLVSKKLLKQCRACRGSYLFVTNCDQSKKHEVVIKDITQPIDINSIYESVTSVTAVTSVFSHLVITLLTNRPSF